MYAVKDDKSPMNPDAVLKFVLDCPQDGHSSEAPAASLLACRVCLAVEGRLYPISGSGLEESLATLSGVTMDCEGLPRHVCGWCATQLSKLSAFRDTCQRSARRLRDLLERGPLKLSDAKALNRKTQLINLTRSKVFQYGTDWPLLTTQLPIKMENVYKPIDEEYTDVQYLESEDFVKKLSDDDSDDYIDVPVDEDSKTEVKSNECERVKVESENKFSEIDSELIGKVDDADNATNKIEVVASNKGKRKRGLKKSTKKKDEVKKNENVDAPKKRINKGRRRNPNTDAAFDEKYNCKTTVLSKEEQKQIIEERKKNSTSPYTCDVCGKRYSAETTLETHKALHDPTRLPLECDVCLLRFATRRGLLKHQDGHRATFTCNQCGYISRYKSHAKDHALTHKGVTYPCRYCAKVFHHQTSHYNHVRNHHPRQNEACDVCGETFTGALGLQQHKTRKHNKPPIPELKCVSCGVQFESLDAVARHTDRTADNACDPSLSACAVCGEAFPSAGQLAAHQLTHNKKTFRCDDCDQPFANKSSLSTHIDRVHLKIKPRYKLIYKYGAARRSALQEYMCETCGKGYTSFANLKTHQLRHTGERPFKCAQCPKSFLTAAQAKGHKERVHAGVKKYQCSQCPKTFLDKSSIYKHKVVHTGEKPYECQICSKAFTQSGSLSTHVKYVHMKLKPPPRRRRNHNV